MRTETASKTDQGDELYLVEHLDNGTRLGVTTADGQNVLYSAHRHGPARATVLHANAGPLAISTFAIADIALDDTIRALQHLRDLRDQADQRGHDFVENLRAELASDPEKDAA